MKRQSTDGWTEKQRESLVVTHEFDSTAMNVDGLRAILKLLPNNAVIATDLESTSLRITLLVPRQEDPSNGTAFRNMNKPEPLAPVVLISRGTESAE